MPIDVEDDEDDEDFENLFNALSVNIERMIARREGMFITTPEEEDILAIIDLYREWRAN